MQLRDCLTAMRATSAHRLTLAHTPPQCACAHCRCVYQKEDEKGVVGVHLSKELMRIAGHALKVGFGGGRCGGHGSGLPAAGRRRSLAPAGCGLRGCPVGCVCALS